MIDTTRTVLVVTLLLAAAAVSGCLMPSDDADPAGPPEAVFTFEPEMPMPEEPVAFTAADSSPGEDEADYAWDFKDGNSAQGANVTHTFAEAGEYPVSLTITSTNGDYDSTVVTVSVGGTPEGSLNESHEGSFSVGVPIENAASVNDHDISPSLPQADVQIHLEATGTSTQFDMTLLDGSGNEVASDSGATEATIQIGELEAGGHTLRIHMTMGADGAYTVDVTGTALPQEEPPPDDGGEPPDGHRV